MCIHSNNDYRTNETDVNLFVLAGPKQIPSNFLPQRETFLGADAEINWDWASSDLLKYFEWMTPVALSFNGVGFSTVDSLYQAKDGNIESWHYESKNELYKIMPATYILAQFCSSHIQIENIPLTCSTQIPLLQSYCEQQKQTYVFFINLHCICCVHWNIPIQTCLFWHEETQVSYCHFNTHQ